MKAFYTVDFTGIGYDGVRTKWFDNKKEADEFAKSEYTDKPVRHIFKREESIKAARALVELTHIN